MSVVTVALALCTSACGRHETGSAPGSSAPAPALAPTTITSHAADSGATTDGFDDQLELPTQPDRAADQQAKVKAAGDALRAVLAKAKTSRDATEFCKAFAPLGKQMVELGDVKPPTGVDPEAFSAARDKIFNTVDLSHPGWCDDPAHASLDELRDMISKVRGDFVAFVGMGAGGAATGELPAGRGKAILQAQLAAVKQWSDPDPMHATFAKDAFVLLPNGEHSMTGPRDLASPIADLNPHSTVTQATFDHFTAGGNASVAWFAAELHFTVVNNEPGYGSSTNKHVVRAIELLDGAAGWKVAVAAFTDVGKMQQDGSSPIEDATEPGPLVQLLVSPPALASALDANALVFGTDPDERGVGAGAKKLVDGWKKLRLTLDTAQKAREVHTATYGYAMTNVELGPAGKTQAMNAFVLALPGAAGKWTVIAASYGATF